MLIGTRGRAASGWDSTEGQPQCLGWFHELVEAVTECSGFRAEVAMRALSRLGVRVEYDRVEVVRNRCREVSLGAFTMLMVASESGLEAMAGTMTERLRGLGWFVVLTRPDGRSSAGVGRPA